MQRPPGYWPLVIGEIVVILLVPGTIQEATGAPAGLTLVLILVMAVIARYGNRAWWRYQQTRHR